MCGQAADKKRGFFRPFDSVVIGVVLAVISVCVFLLFYSDGGDYDREGRVAVISIYGEDVRTVELDGIDEPYTLELEGDMEVVLELSHNGVRFVSSRCPDKLCVKRGLISQRHESAVCLPSKVSVRIESRAGDSVLDAVAG